MISHTVTPDQDFTTGFIPYVTNSLVTQMSDLRREINIDRTITAAESIGTSTLAYAEKVGKEREQSKACSTLARLFLLIGDD